MVESVLLIFLVFCVVLLCVLISTLKRCRFVFISSCLVGVRMSYLCCLCLLTYDGVQHILCCIFVLFFFVLCTLCCQCLWVVLFSFPLRYTLTFMHGVKQQYFSYIVAVRFIAGGNRSTRIKPQTFCKLPRSEFD